MSAIVWIARCPEHGLHGQRDECFVCGQRVERVPLLPVTRGDMGRMIDGVAAPLLRRLQAAYRDLDAASGCEANGPNSTAHASRTEA